MKKKGFTLVELLAVIAILAILVIIALPNVIDMFNNAKKSSFHNELRILYKSAGESYVKDSFGGSETFIYSKNENNNCARKLNVNERGDLYYFIEVNSSGKVTRFYVRDNSFQYQLENDNGIKNTDILLEDVEKISDLEAMIDISCDDVNYVASSSGGNHSNSQDDEPIILPGENLQEDDEPEVPIHYTILYNKNNSNATGSTDPSTHTSGEEKELTLNGYSLSGSSFAGWNTKSDGTGTTYSDGQTVINLTDVDNSTITLYAQWTEDIVNTSYVIADSIKSKAYGINDCKIEFLYTYSQTNNTATISVSHIDFKSKLYQLYLGKPTKNNKENHISIGGSRLKYQTGTKWKNYFNSWDGDAGIKSSNNKNNRFNLVRPTREGSYKISSFETIEVPSDQIVNNLVTFEFSFITYCTQESIPGTKWKWDTSVQFNLLTGEQVE